MQNEDGVSPALRAAGRNDLKMLRLLISAGAKMDTADLLEFTPLKLAQMNKNNEMIQLIKKIIEEKANDQKTVSLNIFKSDPIAAD